MDNQQNEKQNEQNPKEQSSNVIQESEEVTLKFEPVVSRSRSKVPKHVDFQEVTLDFKPVVSRGQSNVPEPEEFEEIPLNYVPVVNRHPSTAEELRKNRKEINDFHFMSLRRVKFDPVARDFVPNKEAQTATREHFKEIYLDGRAAKIAEMILVKAGDYLVDHGLYNIDFGLPVFGDCDITEDGLVYPIGRGILIPQLQLLVHYRDAVTNFLEEKSFWDKLRGKSILSLLRTELLWQYTVFEGIVIIILFYHLIYYDSSRELIVQPDRFGNLLRSYKDRLITCFDIVPSLKALPAPAGREQFEGTEAQVKRVKDKLESIP